MTEVKTAGTLATLPNGREVEAHILNSGNSRMTIRFVLRTSEAAVAEDVLRSQETLEYAAAMARLNGMAQPGIMRGPRLVPLNLSGEAVASPSETPAAFRVEILFAESQ